MKIPDMSRPALDTADSASTPSVLPAFTILVTLDRKRSNIPDSDVAAVSWESNDDLDIRSV